MSSRLHLRIQEKAIDRKERTSVYVYLRNVDSNVCVFLNLGLNYSGLFIRSAKQSVAPKSLFQLHHVATISPHLWPNLCHKYWILYWKLYNTWILYKRILLNVLGPTYHAHLQVPQVKSTCL